MKNQRDDLSDWMEQAKELAKAERELAIEKWVYISIEYKTKEYDRVVLFRYDLPREIYERYDWVIRWRQSRLQCKFPREHILTYSTFYDKKKGLNTNFSACLSKLAASKAQITLAKRKLQEYISCQKQNNLFFDENNDENLIKFREKLKRKEENYNLAFRNMQNAMALQNKTSSQ